MRIYIQKSDKNLIAQFDAHQYDNAALVEIKIPINLPYATDQSDYERMDGEVEFNGVFYNYVKRKISKDTLYILCLPNKTKTKIVSAGTQLVKRITDIPSNKNNKDSSKKMMKANDHPINIEEIRFISTVKLILNKPTHHTPGILHSFIATPIQPPEV